MRLLSCSTMDSSALPPQWQQSALEKGKFPVEALNFAQGPFGHRAHLFKRHTYAGEKLSRPSNVGYEWPEQLGYRFASAAALPMMAG